jgi:hypothetical protein
MRRVSALSTGADTTIVMVGKVTGEGVHPPHPHQAGLNLPSGWKDARKWSLPVYFCSLLCGKD